MLRKTDFIKLGLFFMMLLLTMLFIISENLFLAFIAGSLGLIALIKFIYEYKTQKKDNLIIPVGFYLIILFQSISFWAYNSYISFIFGLLGTLVFIGIIYNHKKFRI